MAVGHVHAYVAIEFWKALWGFSPTVVSGQWSPGFQSLRGLTGALWALEPSRRFGLAVQAVAAGYAAVEGNCFQQLPLGQLGLEINIVKEKLNDKLTVKNF